MIAVLGTITFVLYSVVAFLLVRKYRGTGNAGFLWLGLPLVLLPLAAMPLAFWLQAGVDRLWLAQPVNSFPFALVQQGRLTMGTFLILLNFLEHAVWGLISLFAVLTLNAGRKSRT